MAKSREQIYDELLILKTWQGDKESFEQLIDRWQKRLWHYAFKVTSSEPAAWDVVQETWFAVVKDIRNLEDAAVFPKWVFRILNNKCMDWLRKQHQQAKLTDEFSKQAQNEWDKKQHGSEKIESLQSAVEKLPPERRALLILRYHEGFDIGQTAQILGIPEGTVKSRIHRTLDQLRQIVGHQQND